MLLVCATDCIGVFFCSLIALATSESSSNEAFITFMRTMADLALQPHIKYFAKQLSNITSGTNPSVTQQYALLQKVTELGLEVAAVRTAVAGFEMLVRAKTLSAGYRRHALSFTRFGQCAALRIYETRHPIVVNPRPVR